MDLPVPPPGQSENPLPRADVPGAVPWDAPPAALASAAPASATPARAPSRGLALAVGLALGVGGGILLFRDRPGGDAAPAPSAPSTKGASPSVASSPVATVPAPAGAERVPRPATPALPSPFAAGEAGFLVVGKGAAAVAAAAQARTPAGEPASARRRFVAGTEADGRPGAPLPAGARALIAAGEGAVVLVRAEPTVAEEAPDEVFATPAALVGDVLAGVSLPVPAAAQGAAAAAIAALLLGDGRGARAALEGAPASAGVRVLRAWAATLEEDRAGTHALLAGLGNDPELGPAARFLTGSALLASGSAKEALRDFEAAVAERPAFWPARLMAGVANEALDLEDHADAAYAAVLSVAPSQPTARLRRAALLATPPPGRSLSAEDRAAAVRQLETLVSDRPRFAAAWGALARLRARGATSEDVRATATAFEHVAALREGDPRAWSDLVAARAAWARAGGGADAYAAAADASAKWTALAPEDGLAWYDRGALLHQWALDFAAGPPGAEGFRARLAEARRCYGKALGKGLPRPTAGLVDRNLGFLLDVCPRCGEHGGEGGDLPSTAAEAFQAALTLDAGNVGALLGLVATRIAARDGAEATRLLATLQSSAEVDPREKETLVAAAAALAKPPSGAAAKDPLPDLCRTLIALGYRRVALTLLDGDTKDATRLALRCRARAFLYDVEGLGADLALLQAADPAAAADLRAKDPVVRAALTR